MTAPITRAVWSFWTKPFRAHHASVWAIPQQHLFSWVLSLETARRHFPETVLVTDDAGARMLVDGIGLEFDQVSTELNVLQQHDPEWWVLGKLYTYRAQDVPFVSIDSDVFLWKALPERMQSAALLAQNPENFPFDSGWYRPQVYDVALKATGGWLPPEWEWYVAQRGTQAICCGILGGRRVVFLNDYADRAIRLIEHPRNRTAWSLLGNKIGDNILFEQYFLSACLAYHRQRESSPYHDIDVAFLFDSPEGAFTPQRAREVGYTHLIGGAKGNPILAERLQERVAQSYPAHYERCIQFLNEEIIV